MLSLQGERSQGVRFMPGLSWSPEEDAIMIQLYGKAPWVELLERLPGRTKVALVGRAVILGCQAEKEPYWTPQEERFVREAFGHQTLAAMAQHLGRTETAVKLKAKRLGLRHRQRRALTPSQIGRIMRICPKTVKWWIRRKWLKARVAPTNELTIHLVEIEDLVACLKAHPDRWDARRCPDLHVQLGLTRKHGEAAMGDRPLWLKEKLAADNRRKRRCKPWTPDEDRHLARLVRRGIGYRQTASILGRTYAAIDHRVSRLGRRIWELARIGA